MVIGYWLMSDFDPFWTAIALLVVFPPDLDQTLFVSGSAPRLTVTITGIALAFVGMALVALRGRQSSTAALRSPSHG